jgi:hypothetical protein
LKALSSSSTSQSIALKSPNRTRISVRIVRELRVFRVVAARPSHLPGDSIQRGDQQVKHLMKMTSLIVHPIFISTAMIGPIPGVSFMRTS